MNYLTFINKAKKNFSINIIGFFLLGVLELIKTAVLTKALPLEEYALYVISINLLQILPVIVGFKFHDVIIRFYSIDTPTSNYELLVGVLGISAIIGVVFCLLGTSLSWFIAAELYSKPDLAFGIYIFSCVFLFQTFESFYLAILRVKDKYSWTIVPKIISNIGMVCGFYYYLNVFEGEVQLQGILIIVAVFLVTTHIVSLIRALMCVVADFKGALFRVSKEKIFIWWEKYGRDVFDTGVANYLTIITTPGDIFLLGIFGTEGTVAIYNVAKQIVSPFIILQGNIQSAISPDLVRMSRSGQKSSILRFIKVYIIASLFIVCVVGAGVALYIDEIIMIISNEEYLSAASIALVLLVAAFLTLVSVPFYPVGLELGLLRLRNLLVLIRVPCLLYLFVFGVSAMGMALVHLIGVITLRLFFDFKILRKVLETK